MYCAVCLCAAVLSMLPPLKEAIISQLNSESLTALLKTKWVEVSNSVRAKRSNQTFPVPLVLTIYIFLYVQGQDSFFPVYIIFWKYVSLSQFAVLML